MAAHQCIICLDPLEVEPEGSAPPTPAQLKLLQDLKDQHERLAIEDPEALHKINEKTATSGPGSESYVAEILACGHMLHDSCLREWSDKANSCPICRQTFNIVRVYEKVGGMFLSISVFKVNSSSS